MLLLNIIALEGNNSACVSADFSVLDFYRLKAQQLFQFE